MCTPRHRRGRASDRGTSSPAQARFKLKTLILTHFNIDGVAINEANGKTAQLQENLIVSRDLETGERTWSGMRIKATMPGGGALIIDVGRVIFETTGEVIFEAGQHQLMHEDFADFCTAMG